MSTVLWASIATSNPMGQQRYEFEIQRSLRDAVPPGSGWRFADVRVQSLRGSIPGARRCPVGLYQRASLPVATLLGAAVYRTMGLVHRFDLRLPPTPGPEVATVHDLPPARFDDEGSLPRSIAAGTRRAKMVICPSDFAAREITELLGVERVRVIPYGVSQPWDDPHPATDGDLARLNVRPPFVIHAAGATRRKNLAGLAEAWGRLGPLFPDLTLVLCGPPDTRRDDAFAGLPRVEKTGKLSPEQLAGLFTRAEAVVVPSTYEGFGLPALEGMAAAAPVVAANAGALPEVCSDAALLVEPTGEGLASGLERVLSDASLRSDLAKRGPERARSFSWTKAARQHLDVYEEILEKAS